MSKVNTMILTVTLLLSIISTVSLYSLIPANASKPMAAAKPGTGPGVFRCSSPGVGVNCGDQASWYTVVEGVLAVPNEAPLFPYYHGDVEIGISRFGENIDPFALSQQKVAGSQIMGVGFQYMDSQGQPYDPIRNAYVDINNVIDGWKLVVTYSSAQTNTIRTVWAYAMFSDFVQAGSPPDGAYPTDACPNVMGGWILCPYTTPMPASNVLTPHGGRKTNAFVQTGPILTLYSGPRRVVLASVNVLYDPISGTPGDTSVPVARLTLTFDFNKDTKQLIIIKDVKLLLNSKTTNTITEQQCENLPGPANTIAGLDYVPRFPTTKSQGNGYACIELLDTEQLDVTNGPNVAGYAHFYDWANDEEQNTVKYLVDTDHSAGGSTCSTSAACPAFHWDTGRPDGYDVAQAMDQSGGDENHITSKAFWPIPDWYTVDAKHSGQFFTKLEGTTTTDLLVPPDVVGTSVQWNFILNLTPPEVTNPTLDARIQWRSVETLFVSDRNNGEVCEAPNVGTTTLGDSSQAYTLTNTWVTQTGETPSAVSTVSGTTYYTSATPIQELTSSVQSGSTVYTVITTTTPTAKCFSGNYIDKEEAFFDNMVFNPWDLNTALGKKAFTTFVNYDVATLPSSGTATQTFYTYIPYDYPDAGDYAGSELSFYHVPDDSPTNAYSCTGTWMTGASCWDSYMSFGERVLVVTSTGSATSCSSITGTVTTGTASTTYGNCQGSIPGNDVGSQDVGTLLVRCSGTPLMCPEGAGKNNQYGYTINCPLSTPNSCESFTTLGQWPKGTIFKIIFSRYDDSSGTGGNIGASYEWVTVGRDAATADSLGAAAITEAMYTEEDFHTLIGGQDFKSLGTVNPTIPFVLTQFTITTGDPASDYTECNAAPAQPNPAATPLTGGGGTFLGACPEGARFHLRDDFSSIQPIDGSNIIAVGGPAINRVATLANDFLSVIYRSATMDLFSDGAWDELSTTGQVFQPPQMDCTPAATTNLNLPAGACTFPVTGRAIISTYMDVDGTVYFIVYGGQAQDTFWIAEYFLQYFGFDGLGFKGGPGFMNGESQGYIGVYCSTTGVTNAYLFGQVCDGGYGPGESYLPAQGVTSVVFNIDYTQPHPPSITIFKELNTISEIFPEQDS